MMLEALREEVLQANLDLVREGLVIRTFGNASGISRSRGLVVIKPSGVPYASLKPIDMVVTDLEGMVVEGALRPSSDLPAHLVLYRNFEQIGGVVHTHSRFATAWAQAGREIPCLGTTHADYFYGPVPITDPMSVEEVGPDYEAKTGEMIVRRFDGLDPARLPAALVCGHGPFCWGSSSGQAVEIASVLEEIARIAYLTVQLNPGVAPLPAHLHDRHFLRKHGPTAYYGQE